MTTTGDHATDLTALLAAIREHLDIPKAAYGGYDKQVRLRYDRAISVLGTLDAFLDRGVSPARAIETLRQTARTYLHADYPTALAEARDHPADCQVCGPDCCSPVLGIHSSSPGPHAGAAVAGVR